MGCRQFTVIFNLKKLNLKGFATLLAKTSLPLPKEVAGSIPQHSDKLKKEKLSHNIHIIVSMGMPRPQLQSSIL